VKSFFWLVVGVGLGFAVAHKINDTAQGRQFFSDIDKKARDFGTAVSDGYHKREAELRTAIAGEDAN
jgi:hypothetical protein